MTDYFRHRCSAVVRTAAGAALLVAAVLSQTLEAPTAQAATESCEARTLELPSGRVAGDLCLASDPSSTLIITLAGGTYGGVYWDFPYQPETYSFVSNMMESGYSVLNIDRLGTGESEHPPSLQLTVPQGAESAHEVVQAARSGELGHTFSTVVLVGHSVGSTIAQTEAATYHDVDAVIITGLFRKLNLVGIAAAFSTFYPAMLDERFAGEIVDPGYVTQRPGTRGVFYHLPNVDPQVVEIDEATKETATLGEMSTFGPFIVPGQIAPVCGLLPLVCDVNPGDLTEGPTGDIDVPVLMVSGQLDAQMCGGVGTDCSSEASALSDEAPFWESAPCVDLRLVPNAGHDINLHRNAPEWYRMAADWLDGLPRADTGRLDCAPSD